jgi:hypothetical protein
MKGVKQVTKSYILQKAKICSCTLTTYLCRAEFSHIEKLEPRSRGKEIIFKNVTQKDIDRLIELVHGKKRKRKKDED